MLPRAIVRLSSSISGKICTFNYYDDVYTWWHGCSELPRMSHCHFASTLTETTVTPGNYVAWIQCLNVRQPVWVHFPALHVSRWSLAEVRPPWRFKIVYYRVTGVTRDISRKSLPSNAFHLTSTNTMIKFTMCVSQRCH